MKKTIALLMCGLFMSLTACGNSDSSSTAPLPDVDTTTTTTTATTTTTTSKATETVTEAETTTSETETTTTTTATTTESVETTTPAETTTTAATSIKVTSASGTMYTNCVANMRSGNSASYPVVQQLKQNTKVTITGKCDNGWYKVEANGKSGYMSNTVLSKDKVTTTTTTKKPSDSPSNAKFKKGDTVYVIYSTHIYEEPDKSSHIVNMIYKNLKLEVAGEPINGFYPVDINEPSIDEIVYIEGHKISKQKLEDPKKVISIMYVKKGESVELRTENSASAPVGCYLGDYTKVAVTDICDNGWYEVREMHYYGSEEVYGSHGYLAPGTLVTEEEMLRLKAEEWRERDLQTAYDVIDLVNELRVENGLNELEAHEILMDAGMVRAKELNESFSHTRPNGKSGLSAIDEAGGEDVFGSCGENIYQGMSYTATAIFDAFYESEGHRENMLGAGFDCIGVGIYTCRDVVYKGIERPSLTYCAMMLGGETQYFIIPQ